MNVHNTKNIQINLMPDQEEDPSNGVGQFWELATDEEVVTVYGPPPVEAVSSCVLVWTLLSFFYWQNLANIPRA